MKLRYKIRLNSTISGLEYSNNEHEAEWEFEGSLDEIEEQIKKAEETPGMLERLAKISDDWVGKRMESVGGKFKNLIEEQNSKLAKAREEFIKLRRGEYEAD